MAEEGCRSLTRRPDDLRRLEPRTEVHRLPDFALRSHDEKHSCVGMIIGASSTRNVGRAGLVSPSCVAGTPFIDDYLPLLLARAADAVSSKEISPPHRPGITAPVWRVLATLFDHPDTPVTRLAETCLLQQPTATKLLAEMERNGLVLRRQDRLDRRVVRVVLTPKGEAVTADLIDAARRHEAALLARHPQAGEIKDVLRALIAQRNRSRGPRT
jgi:DNA-binding MarR family transcriptional regulator